MEKDRIPCERKDTRENFFPMCRDKDLQKKEQNSDQKFEYQQKNTEIMKITIHIYKILNVSYCKILC